MTMRNAYQSALASTASLMLAAAIAVTTAACAGTEEAAAPVEEAAPVVGFQTDAPLPEMASTYTVEEVASGLDHPWSLAFLPDGRMLVTERPGRMRIITPNGQMSEPLGGLPPIRASGGEGLLDVALDPDFAENRLIYFTYFAPPDGEPGGPFDPALLNAWMVKPPEEREATPVGFERVGRARLSDDATRLEDADVIVEGGDRRLAFAPDGSLFITTATPSGGNVPLDDLPQSLDSYHGKVLRVNPDGTIPADNPYVDTPDARPDVYLRGMKDPEGATIHPQTGQLWTLEHGPMGGDEVNIARPGANLGYAEISYGLQYSGEPVGDGASDREGMQQPVYYWVPSVAPSGMTFYTGDLFPEWQGDLFVGAMSMAEGRFLIRLVVDGEQVTHEERLLTELEKRIRDVRQGPDGALYVLTDEDAGQLLRIVPGT